MRHPTSDEGIARTSGTSPRAAVVVACIALFTDMLVYGLAIPVLPLLPSTVNAGPTGTGILFASYAAALLAVTPVAGRLVDQAGPRRPLLIGLIGLAAATLLFAVGGPYWLLLLARVLQGIAGGMSWVASLSLIAAVTPFASRGRAMGLAMGMVSIGVLVGPPLAGILVESFGVKAPFVVAAGLALADGVVRILMVRETPAVTDDPAGPVTVLRVPGSWAILTSACLGAAIIAAIEPVLPLHLTQNFGLGALGIGLLFGLAVLSGAVLGPAIGSLVGRVNVRVLLGIGGVLSALSLLGLGNSVKIWQIAAALAVLGAASGAFLLSPATTLIGFQGQHSNPPALGGAYALFNLAYASGLMVGPLVAGLAVGELGFATAMTMLAAAVLIAVLTSLPHLPTDPTARATPNRPREGDHC